MANVTEISKQTSEIMEEALAWADKHYDTNRRKHYDDYSFGSWWYTAWPRHIEYILQKDGKEPAMLFAKFVFTPRGSVLIDALTSYHRDETDEDKIKQGYDKE